MLPKLVSVSEIAFHSLTVMRKITHTLLTILVSGPGYPINAQIRLNINFKDKIAIAIEISQCLLEMFLKNPMTTIACLLNG